MQAILNVTARADIIQISLKESDTLDAHCIERKSRKMIAPSQITIQVESPYPFLRNFADSFINPPQKLENIEMPLTYLSNSKVY